MQYLIATKPTFNDKSFNEQDMHNTGNQKIRKP